MERRKCGAHALPDNAVVIRGVQMRAPFLSQRLAGLASIIIAWAIVPVCANAASGTPPTPAHSPVKLIITAAKSTFRVGEPILLKVDVQNASAEPVWVLNLTPWDATTLIIVRNGMLVRPSSPPAAYEWKFPYATQIQPGGTLTLHWDSASNPITYWGYAPLSAGHYIITVVPKRIEGRVQPKNHFMMEGSLLGNSIHVDILP
jgi:hypothetical protein